MADKIQSDSVTVFQRPTYFVLATLFASPFAGGLGLFVVAWMYHKPQLLTYLLIPCMFFWPILAVVAFFGFIFVAVGLFRTPRYSILLVIDLLFIVGFGILGWKLISSIGPG